METRAHHLMIGLFTIAIVIGSFWFVLWLGKLQIDREYVYYDIVFRDAVSGLGQGAEVHYQGINVGNVVRIAPDQEMRGGVRVTVRLSAENDIRVRANAKASLELQGLTGLAYVLILPQDGEAPVLPRVFDIDQDRPEIQSERSQLQSLFTNLPALLSAADELLRDMRKFTTDQNANNVAAVIASVEELTRAVAARSEQIDETLLNVAAATRTAPEAVEEITALARQLNTLADTLDQVVQRDLPQAVQGIGSAAGSVDQLARNTNRLILNNEEAINAFTQQGLAQIGVLAAETRQTVQTVNRVARRLESDPSGFIFGGSQPVEVEPRR